MPSIHRKIKPGPFIRGGLAVCGALIVLWSFYVVLTRQADKDPVRRAKTHITMLQWGNDDATAEIRRVVAGFEKTHPDVAVDVLQTNDFDSKLYTMFAGNQPPDVFYLTDDNESIYANRGMLLNLDPFIDEDVRKEGHGWIDDYYPELFNWFKFDGQHEGRGHQYAMPAWHTPFAMRINVDLFKRCNLRIPVNGWTWDEYERDIDAISKLSTSQTGAGRIYGAAISSHQYALRTIIWGYGGKLFGGANDDDETRIALGEPGAIKAFEMIRRQRFQTHAMYNPADNASISQSGEDPATALFNAGRLGVTGPGGYWNTRENPIAVNNEYVPCPSNVKSAVSCRVGIGWAVALHSRHPREAYELARYMSGPVAQTILARDNYFLPVLQSVANSDAFINDSRPAVSTQTWITTSASAKVPHWPQVKDFLFDCFKTYTERTLTLNKEPPAQAAQEMSDRWAAMRASPVYHQASTPMPWNPIYLAVSLLVICVGGILLMRTIRRWRRIGGWKHELSGWLFISPWLIGFLVFTLGPMADSLLLSFTQWSPVASLDQARWTGLANYVAIFTTDPLFWSSVRVTLIYTLIALPMSQILALGLAIMLNSGIPGVGIFRTLYFVPWLVTGVVLAAIGRALFSNEYGLINAVLRGIFSALDHLLKFVHFPESHLAPPNWLGIDAPHWAIPALAIMALWGVGGSMVIYLAALKGVPTDLYESARLDGAGPRSQFWHITMPMISPIVQFNLIMGLIGSFQVFTLVKVLTGGGPDNATRVYVLHLYEIGFQSMQMGIASAMAWVLFVVVLLITAVAFRSMRRWVYYEGLAR